MKLLVQQTLNHLLLSHLELVLIVVILLVLVMILGQESYGNQVILDILNVPPPFYKLEKEIILGLA